MKDALLALLLQLPSESLLLLRPLSQLCIALPSLLRDCSLAQSALELLSMGAGIAFMILVLVLEDYLG